MKISVIMIDGGFRENAYAAKYFNDQDFPQTDYEILWVEYTDRIHPDIQKYDRVIGVPLHRRDDYHPAICFNHGISVATGEILVIVDADLIVAPEFLSYVWAVHQQYRKLVVYGQRYDEKEKGSLKSHDLDELDRHCIMKNPLNYGACLTVRKSWMLEINGYEQHSVFRSGFHASGLDLYTRFRNRGLAIQWEPKMKLYHPWHPNTYILTPDYETQLLFIEWRSRHLHWNAVEGLDDARNGNAAAVEEYIASQLAETVAGGKGFGRSGIPVGTFRFPFFRRRRRRVDRPSATARLKEILSRIQR